MNFQLKEDENGCVFIDRDPKHFRLILNFMRDEDVVLPESLKEIQEILKEAKNYELDGLVKICIEKVPAESAAKPKFRLIESDVQMMQIVTNPEKVRSTGVRWSAIANRVERSSAFRFPPSA